DRSRRAVGTLGAADYQVVAPTLDRRRDGAGGTDRIGVFQRRVGDQDAPMRPHRECSPDGIDRLGRAHRNDRHLTGILFDKLQPRLDPVLVAGVENQVDALADQPLGLGIELARRVGIGNLLYANEDVHGWLINYEVATTTLSAL